MSDWQPILTDLPAHPFGRIARYFARHTRKPEDEAAAPFFWEAPAESASPKRIVNEMKSFGEFGLPLTPLGYYKQNLPALLEYRHPDSARICLGRSHRLL